MLQSTNHRSVKEYSVTELKDVLTEEYGQPRIEVSLRQALRRLKKTFGELHLVSDKRILDIGCGCVGGAYEARENPPGTWGPWLPRAVMALGGHAVGVDIGRVHSSEKFEFHQVNLLRNNPLEFLKGRSFDAINCSNFFSSPHLLTTMRMRDKQKRMDLRESLLEDAQKLLTPDGFFIEFDTQFEEH